MWKVVGELGRDLIALVGQALPDKQQFWRLFVLVLAVFAFVGFVIWLS